MPTNIKNNVKTGPSIILGIDPGYGRVGIAIVSKEGGKETLIYSECFETEKKTLHEKRLAQISRHLHEIFHKWKPEKIAVETLLFSKNVKTALKVAEARGIILSEAAKLSIPIFEFNPNTIKLAITGYGKSDKKQIKVMIEKIAKPKNKIKHDDEYDAIAVALTCAATTLSTQIRER